MKALKTTMIVVGAAVAGAGATAWFLSHRPLALRPAASAAAPQRDEEMAALKSRLANLEARAIAAANTPHSAGPTITAKHDTEDQRDPDLVEREQKIARWMDTHYTTEVQARVFGRYFADVDRVRLAERRDMEWGESVRQNLQKLLETPAFAGTQVERLECGSTLCRLHLEGTEPKRRDRLLNRIQIELQFGQASALMPPNEKKMEAYLARQGVNLPDFDQIKYLEPEMD